MLFPPLASSSSSKDDALQSASATLRDVIVHVFSRVAATDSQMVARAGPNFKNALYASCMGYIELVCHYGGDAALLKQAAVLLGSFIDDKVLNVRYIGLAGLAALAQVPNTGQLIVRHRNTVVDMLQLRDVSIRRRALDLLFAMCDSKTSQTST